MTDLDRTLSELARVRSRAEPVVSLYLDVRWRDEQQRERVRVFVREGARRVLGHYLAGSPGRDGLARTLQEVEAYVEGLAGQAHRAERAGLALFACESLGLWRALLFGRAFENDLATDAIPHLTRLARLAGDVLPAFVVAPDQDGTEIFQVTRGEVTLAAAVPGAPERQRGKEASNAGTGKPGRHHEREAKDERHEENRVMKNRRVAAAELTLRSDRAPHAGVVLVATAEVAAAFERELPDRVRARVAARVPRPRGWETGDGARRERARAIAEATLSREAEDEKLAVDRVVGEALRGGLGVLGPGDVVLALNEGRVHTLVLEADFARTGWRCENCGALGESAGSAERCPFCAGDVWVVRDLGEALVARTLAEGGRVEVVGHTNKLHGYRGVGALLRQTAATGLRGARHPWPTAPGASQP